MKYLFVLLMVGTVSVYLWSMRPIKVETKKEKKLHLETEKTKKRKHSG
jgi:hypothetical protein